MDESLLTIVIVDKSVYVYGMGNGSRKSDTLKLISLAHKVRPHFRMRRSLWLLVIGYPVGFLNFDSDTAMYRNTQYNTEKPSPNEPYMSTCYTILDPDGFRIGSTNQL